MPKASRTFSESWYRVADQRIGLRPHVKVRRQFFRGEKWYVLQDAFNNQFYRLRPAAYDFVARLRSTRTVDDVWQECLERDPENAPGQQDVIQILSQLYLANLLQYRVPEDSAKLFERYRKRRQREVQSKLLGIMFARFPLFDPDDFLRRCLPVAKKLISPVGAVLWFLVVAGALKVAVDHGSELVDQSQGILAPANLFLLYLGLVVVKVLHEFGHAFACRRFGGEVHVMGVMLLVFTPIPYMDATSSWAFRNRWHRVLVGSAGMIVEVFVAALATFVWVRTGPGALHSLMYNMMFIASVSTLLFNANPLLRFDGYYILSDLLDIPNLHQQARGFLRHLFERYVFGWKDSESPAATRKERVWLVVFGVTSGIYRVFVFTAIILFVADRFLLAGAIMAIVCVISWVLVPMGRFVHYLATSPRLERTRLRAVGVTVGAVGILLCLLGAVPFPSAFRAPGILKATEYRQVAVGTSGALWGLAAASGDLVGTDQPLAELRNPELEYELVLANAQVTEARAAQRKALGDQAADLKPISAYLASVEKRLGRLEEDRRRLTVRAELDGIWVSPEGPERRGEWIVRGSPLGEIVNPARFEFAAIVSQADASRLFGREIRDASVRLHGQAGYELKVEDFTLIPAEQETLPSAALGWQAGGELQVALTDATGLQAAEPFFQVMAQVSPLEDVAMLHGRSGRIRFRLGPEPLLQQWGRRFRQLLQERYQL